MSVESMRELVVGYRKKKFSTKRWKTPEDMLRSITNDFNIWILPLKEEQAFDTLTGEMRDFYKTFPDL